VLFDLAAITEALTPPSLTVTAGAAAVAPAAPLPVESNAEGGRQENA